MHKLGAHLSIVGGYTTALDGALAIGGNTLQIFSSSPRSWGSLQLSDGSTAAFRQRKQKLGIDPVYFHASYLINLADMSSIGRRSQSSLIQELKAADKLGIRGSIIHLGSFKDNHHQDFYRYLIENIQRLLSGTPATTLFIIENSATNKIGKSLEEIARIIGDVDSARLRVCLDTCHLHAAGYDLTTSDKLDHFLSQFDRLIGLPQLELIHVNDSRDEPGSGRDRHANIGQGKVGSEVFRLILNHPRTRHLPFIIETPGFADKGPDKQNLDILKSMIV